MKLGILVVEELHEGCGPPQGKMVPQQRAQDHMGTDMNPVAERLRRACSNRLHERDI